MVCQYRWMVVLVWVSVATAAADQYEQQSESRAADNQDLQIQQRLKREADQTRPKRDYIQWYGQSTFQQPNFQQSIFHQPSYPPSYQPSYIPSYQLSSRGSYYIPVWGDPRRIPIYFPQKPILFNPGYPVRNPPRPEVRPTEAPTTINGQPIDIGSRLGEVDYNENGEPIWGIVEPEPASRPKSPPSTMAPTRPPVSGARPSRPPTPPLLHRPSLDDRDSQQSPQPSNFPSQSFPPPENNIQFRPQGTTTTTTPRPRPTTPPPKNKEEPNRCVWAIISCCNPTNNEVRYNCFEQLGCPGAFWDSSPCSRDTVAAAFSAAAKFYE